MNCVEYLLCNSHCAKWFIQIISCLGSTLVSWSIGQGEDLGRCCPLKEVKHNSPLLTWAMLVTSFQRTLWKGRQKSHLTEEKRNKQYPSHMTKLNFISNMSHRQHVDLMRLALYLCGLPPSRIRPVQRKTSDKSKVRDILQNT